MDKLLKILSSIAGGILGVGALLPLIYETTDKGIHYLDTHSAFQRGVPFAIALVSAILAGGLLGGWNNYGDFRWSITVQGESRKNPAYGILIIALLINCTWVLLLE